MRALALLFLLSLFQTPTFAPIQQEARKKISDSNLPFTPDAFIQSVIEGDKEKVEWYLKAGMSPDVAYNGEKYFKVGDKYISKGDPALIIAMKLDHKEIISLLIRHGVNVNKPSSYPASPLMVAKGDLVKTLLDRGADVNWQGYVGYTPLMNAVSDDDLDKVTLLLDRGADINVKNERGQTAIEIAAVAGKRELFTLLRERGADTGGLSERSIKMLMNAPDLDDEVMRLLERLRDVRVGDTITGPSLEEQKEVPRQLLKMADKSAESRAQVIDRLMDVVEDLSAKYEGMIANRWMAAVEVLGQLKATEAIDMLVNNLDHTGQNGVVLSIHIQPVYTALVKIGEPAIPKLVEALAHPKPYIRSQAAWVLYSIQKGGAKAAIEAALQKETDKEIQQGFKSVLDRIKPRY